MTRVRLAASVTVVMGLVLVGAFWSATRMFSVCHFDPMTDIARMQVTKLSQRLELYRLDNGSYPASQQELVERGYASPHDLEDPWHRSFHYARYGEGTDQRLELYTLGPDGASPLVRE